MRPRLVLVLGVVTLLLATALAGSLAWTVLREPVTTSFGGVTVSTEGFGAVIAADLVITPRVRATFEGLDGTLLVGEQRVDYTLDGVRPGDELAPQTPRELTVRVEMGLSEIAAATLRLLGGGELAVAFDGTVDVSVIGIGVSVPVTFERTVDFGQAQTPPNRRRTP